jgi:uncharacterized protein YkwD
MMVGGGYPALRIGSPLLFVVLAAGCPKVESTTASPTVHETKGGGDGAAGSGEKGKLEGITDAHNAVRKKVGAPPLRWSRPLARHAHSWAQRLAAKDCALQHRRTDAYGENLFWSSGPVEAKEVVAEWASEAANYDRRTHRCKGKCGHYTQVVWSDTRSLGCGMATCGTAEVWVCNYDPPGNVSREFKRNVLPTSCRK